MFAHEVSNRQLPRVLLADEVGLGKTIEACLILNRMLVCGRANRILIILPNSLVNQWFVELLRRFNHWFSIFDEERCVAIEAAQTDFNPFEDDQLIIASIDWLAESAKRTKQVTQAPWDLLIVDEAHHLQYHPDKPSAQYQLVEVLGQRAGSLLLLTATPQQLGLQSHFARLRLLDPNRFSDFEVFKEETANYEPVAKLCQKIIANEDLRKSELDQFPATNAILAKVNSELANGRFISLPKEMKNGPAHLIPEFGQLNKLIPPMVETGEQLASEQATELKQHTVADMRKKLSAEINRLETLAKINMNVRPGEISLLKEEQKKLEQCLGQARSRLDSIRLIWKGSMERLQN
ncbi:SNF2-related protein [bacterium]|nr:SNF2-related protein [bacterium]